MLCENQIDNVWVNKKPSASYDDMISIISDDLVDQKYQQHSLQSEDDLLLLSKAVDNVLSNHSNIKVTSLKRNIYSHVSKKQISSPKEDNEELICLLSELQLTKRLVTKKQTELDIMENQLRTALVKMLEFVVKYEKYLL